jgi:two-component system, NarL family, nitrate/nitrite response regulator NarL
MAKLAVLDPSGLFRAGLVSLLQALGFVDLIEAADMDELARLVGDGPQPDVLLVNLSRPDQPIDEIMQEVNELFEHARVVFLAEALDLELLARCFAAGASGYLLENISRDTLSKSLTLVNAGGKVFPPELAPYISALAVKPADGANGLFLMSNSRLSGRELEILHCLTRGQSNKSIGQTLEIAEATVKVHVKRILRKIHATNRTQAALWAAARGLATIANINEPESEPMRELVPAGMSPPHRHVAMRQAIALKTSPAK